MKKSVGVFFSLQFPGHLPSKCRQCSSLQDQRFPIFPGERYTRPFIINIELNILYVSPFSKTVPFQVLADLLPCPHHPGRVTFTAGRTWQAPSASVTLNLSIPAFKSIYPRSFSQTWRRVNLNISLNRSADRSRTDCLPA